MHRQSNSLSRSSQSHDGRPRALSEILSQLQALRGHGRSMAAGRLSELWKRIAGTEISERTRVIGLRNGVLIVAVSNAALLGELTSFHQHDLTQALRRDPEGQTIKKLRFQLRAK